MITESHVMNSKPSIDTSLSLRDCSVKTWAGIRWKAWPKLFEGS